MAYEHQEYPKHLYHKTHTAAKPNVVIVENDEAEAEATAAGFQATIPDPKSAKKQQMQKPQEPPKE